MATLAIISVMLNFLPMLPIQILLTNLISDGPLLSISTDKVDEGELTRPRNWNIKLIGRFAKFFGGISSVFDFVTISLTLILVGSNIALFRTCWFIESTLSDIIVTFAIRTRMRFYKSMPSKILLLSSVVFGLLTVLLPYSPLSEVFEFYPPTPFLLSLIFGVLLLYFIVVETVKRFFHEKGARKRVGANPSDLLSNKKGDFGINYSLGTVTPGLPPSKLQFSRYADLVDMIGWLDRCLAVSMAGGSSRSDSWLSKQ